MRTQKYGTFRSKGLLQYVDIKVKRIDKRKKGNKLYRCFTYYVQYIRNMFIFTKMNGILLI